MLQVDKLHFIELVSKQFHDQEDIIERHINYSAFPSFGQPIQELTDGVDVFLRECNRLVLIVFFSIDVRLLD